MTLKSCILTLSSLWKISFMRSDFSARRKGGGRGSAHGPQALICRQAHKSQESSQGGHRKPPSTTTKLHLTQQAQFSQLQRVEPSPRSPAPAPTAPAPHRATPPYKTRQPSPAGPPQIPQYNNDSKQKRVAAYVATDSGVGRGAGTAPQRDRRHSGGRLVDGADGSFVDSSFTSDDRDGGKARDHPVQHRHRRGDMHGGGQDKEESQAEEGAEVEEDEEPLRSELSEELRELERLYGAPNRTCNSCRSRQERLDRQAAVREAMYGVRHRDADVRLLALRREMAAAGDLRRRGRFAVDDAMPRRSTWHKLPPRLQLQILEERSSELLRTVGLPRAAGRRLYQAAPGLLCDISYGVGNRLRALADRLGITVEAAAAAIAARPLLGDLRPDVLEATAAELAAWLGGLPLSVVLQRLVEEPSVAVDGPAALITRCQALGDSLGLSRMAALQLLLRNPRLMVLQPHDVAARVAIARRLVLQAVEAGEVAGGATPGSEETARAAPMAEVAAAAGFESHKSARVNGGGGAGGGVSAADAPPPGLMLCTENQLDSCLELLQQLLPLSRPAAARLLVAQPALALQPAQSLRAAVDFLAAHLPPPPPSPPPPLSRPGSRVLAPWLLQLLQPQAEQRQPGRTASRGPSPAERLGKPLQHRRRRRQQQQQQLPPPHVLQLVMQCPDVLLLQPRRAADALDCLSTCLAQVAAAALSQAVTYDMPCGVEPLAAQRSNAVVSVSVSNESNDRRLQRDDEMLQQEASATTPSEQLAPQTDLNDSVGDWQAARGAAAGLVLSAPRLLLCQLLPSPNISSESRAGGGPRPGWSAAIGRSARERQTSVMAWVKAVDEAQRMRRVDASSVALDGPDWPLPILSLPYDAGDGHGDETDSYARRRRGGGNGAGLDDEQQLPGNGNLYGGHNHRRRSDAAADASTASLAALRVAAAAAGATAVPIDLAVREAELLQLLGLRLSHHGNTYDSRTALARLRLWLWQHVVPAAPSVLLLPLSRLAATVDQLCAWLAVPPEALVPYLIPVRPLPTSGLSPMAAVQLSAPAEGQPAQEGSKGWGLPSQHMALLAARPEALQSAGYRLWSWLGGAAAAAAPDVSAVLRALPGLLYDSMTMRLCALVLHTALGGMDGCGASAAVGAAGGSPAHAASPSTVASPAHSGAGSAPASPVIGGVSMPTWVLVLPLSADAISMRSPAPAAAATAVPAMPAAAAALLRLHPDSLLCDGVLRLLETPSAAASESSGPTDAVEALATANLGGLAGSGTVDASSAGGDGGVTRLGRAVQTLAGLMGISLLAAAAVVLATRGSAAKWSEQLPPGATARIENAMLLVRGGGAWLRELQRYLYGSTAGELQRYSYGSTAGAGGAGLGASHSGGGGLGATFNNLESLEAVSASARELLVVVRQWRRVSRLEALTAAGLQDVISFAVALEMPQDDWQALAARLGLTQADATE